MTSLSTHVLDVEHGVPAAGVLVELYRDGERLAGSVTDANGRIGALADALQPGVYQLVFKVADYLGAQDRPAPFLQEVSVNLRLDANPHYHVPLLLSPYACTTYRGS